jgi:hypothetical protein
VLGTQDSGNDVNVQVYDGDAGTWGDLQEVIGGAGGVSDNTARGFDIAYESLSGDAIVVYCDGNADPSYYVWNGSTWTSGGTINLASANNCEWIKLASDPVSDEIILVSRDTSAGANDYEALVWDGSAWGNSTGLFGNMTDALNEGIAVEYEESGNQAVVAVSNGDTSGISWTSWSGTEWTVVATQGMGDDFEWGVMKRDAGSDQMALCYADQDDDLGLVRWDGDGWQTNQEFETGGNTAGDGTVDGRPISCEFETTAGRDGYIMLPHANTASLLYEFWNGSTLSGESDISTIQDSWTVQSVRTGDGKILVTAHDDPNSRYDFSYWNGSSWSAQETLENSASVTAEPFREPLAMAARIYQSLSGTILSDPVDFDWVPGQPSWGEALFSTTEPVGTNVVLHVLYESGGACTWLVPDTILPGNATSTGFDASNSPIDLSGLSTTTYNRLCLRATFSSASQNVPTLNDWTLTWERQPYLTQEHFRWYVNANVLTPTDPWPSGAADVAEDTGIISEAFPSKGDVLRLRMGILNENVALSASSLSMTLQYAEGSSCSASMNWLDVGAIGSTTALWRGSNNASVSDGATLSGVLLSTSDVNGTYEEENDSTLNPNGASTNQTLEYDWVIQHNASSSIPFCFRAITAEGETLNAYDVYPSLITNAAPTTPLLEKPFDNEAVASTSPWFEFAAEDPESNDITYQIQVDDDYSFASPTLDRNSQDHFNDFTNIITPSDKDPFNSGQTVRYVPTSSLTNGTTYYWRVRARDRNNSQDWSSWSSVQSVTINTSVTITTWFQTRLEQFETDSFEDTEATSTHEVVLTPPLTTGTTTSSSIDFDQRTNGNAWGSLSWNDNETTGDILYRIEYLNGSSWELIPDADLPGNAAGFDTSPVSLLGLSPTTYNEIRVRANFTNVGGTPRLSDWTIAWGFAVEQPTLLLLFDNEKTGTTTPSFTFFSTDPQNDDLVYQISLSQTTDFAASTTRSSNAHAGFVNIASSTDASPFVAGDTIRFTLQPGDALSNGTTYWWRVRARDPGGGDTWSVWSPLRSFTVDTGVTVSTWFQTTDEQFDTDTLNDTETFGSDNVRITTTIREAFLAYAEGSVQAPRYRLWNGETWGNESTGENVGDIIRFVESASAPTRDEYMIVTQGSTGVVDAQVYNGSTDSTGNLVEIDNAVSDALQRGFDVAYETNSGDALVVACDGTEAVYRVWNGSSWSATTTIALAVTNNCEWVKLASDPTSDEIIAVFRDTTAGATDFQALVWGGSSWGNSSTFGSQGTANNEGIAVEYEESGGQAVVVVSNGAASSFIWNAWNGSSWGGTNTVTIGDDFGSGRLVRDLGSDEMALCYADVDSDIGFVEWSGSAWGGFTELELTGQSANGRPVTCDYETTAGRDNFVMVPYSDTTQAEYQYWDGASLVGPVALTTISDSWELRSARTGDGNILVVAYDDANTEYDFTYWNGSAWSSEQVLETSSIATQAPATVPLDIVARRYPAFTSGTVVASAIDFDDGLGPKWGSLSWGETTPGTSNILMQLEYESGGVWSLIPDVDLPDNAAGTSTNPWDISAVNRNTYNVIRPVANLNCVSGDCPTLDDWTLTWSEGITVSGTAHQYDQSTPVNSGTVAVAVNDVLQVGKTGTISGGAWSIPNVTVFGGDIVTVFIDGAADANEAIGIAKYDDVGDVTGINLFERHLSIGSNDNQTITNADLALFDNSNVDADEDNFHDVDGGNDLSICIVSGCIDAELWIKTGNTYRPDSASSGNVATHDIEINGTVMMDGNTFTVNGSWDNNGTTTADTSTVIFTATSTTETIDSTGAASASFNNVTLGQTSGTATWNLGSTLDVNGALAINFGTLSQGSRAITIASNFTIGSSGLFSKGSATTTFDGSGSSVWTDNTSSKQDMGTTTIDGTTKTVTLGSGVKVTNLSIGADDTLDVTTSNYGIEVTGNFTNNNIFTARNGTVTFSATDTGHTITPGSSSFYNLTFNGSGGNWAFSGGTVSANNDFTITNGTVTLASGTTTVAGSFQNSGGTFMHNNGVVNLTASGAKSVQPASSSFYDLTFDGSGSWSFVGSATSSRHTRIATGAVTLPSGVLAVGGSFLKNGGSFTHNSGTIKFTATNAQTIRLGGSDAYNVTFDGSGGSWSFSDTNATSTNAVRFENGTATLPSGIFAVGGSWTVTSGSFTHNSGTVKFNSSDTGETINPAGSWFYNLSFDNPTGGWTVAAHATSTATTTLVRASDFTLASGQSLAVGGVFTNLVGGASTTWTGSTLFLNSGSGYTINTKTAGGDGYATLLVGANTDVKMWNSSAATSLVDATGSLYSQDNATVDGDLYIWGEYVASDEYWNYSNDFDGTVLSGVSQRQANVRVGNNASIRLSSGNLRIIGTSTATTTISNQGAGTYSLTVAGGTLNARYYSVRNTDVDGFYLRGTPTVSSLANGDFELGVTGGTMLALDATVIDQNPTLQIQQVRFATSTGVLSGSNVLATTTPSSYWWFRNHYGNYDGEDFDVDPGGNPGFIRWDDSGIDITVSGTVYSDHGDTAIGNPPCDGSTPVVRILITGTATSSYSGSCNPGTGAFSIPNVQFTGDVVMTTYLNTNGGRQAVTVTKTPTSNIGNMHLYENTLIVRHEDTEAMTIADLAVYDEDDDADVFFNAATTTATLTVRPERELFIWSGKTFAPGGNMTLQSGGSGNARDGRLYIATSSAFVAAGTESHSIGGGLTASSSASLAGANATFTFVATTTGKLIDAVVPLSFYNLTFNGAGGGWSLISTATTTVQNNFLATAGTLSGTGNVIVSSGDLTGNGAVAMTGGVFELEQAGDLGGNTAWTFYNLTLGSTTNATTTKFGSGTTTVSNVLHVRTPHEFRAGSAPLVLSGGGTPFVVDGVFLVQTATTTYNATVAANIADETYGLLRLAPSGSGSPTYSLMGGTLTASDIVIGDGGNAVTVTADANDPSISLSDDLIINPAGTFVASNVGAFDIAGSWTNLGAFTHSNGSVLFESADAGETIAASSSPFYNLTFDNAGGGWTFTQSATSSNNLSLTNLSSVTVANGQTLAVGGTFTNGVGGGATTWTGSRLYLYSGTSYSANTKSAGSDTYATLLVGPNTDVRMWNSSAAVTTVDSTGSLYSQDHAGVDGDLYVWGEYTRSSGSDYWSYATDFDGTDITGSERRADVFIATSSVLTFSGGVLDIIGTSTASTTIQNQGTGRYAFNVTGGTLTARYYVLRNTDPAGLALSGSPTISSLSDGDFELGVNGGTMMTVAGSVIDANPLKIIVRNSFATSTGVASGANVTATGSSASSWKFNLHYGNYAGEAFDSDPTGDPGYLRWDDSASDITISGNVYSDEGSTVSSVCDNSTPVVRLLIQGAGALTSSCNSSTGAFSIPNVFFNPGDVLTVYLNTDGGTQAANISIDPITNITDMHLYENRVIVRHEDTAPLNIADMTVYDSDQDSDIPFDAEDAATDTLTLPPERKLIVWNNKTFAPAGNITVQSGGSGTAWDGTLELRANAVFSAAGTQSHSVGGSLLIGSGASFSPANSTFTMTATTTGKTIQMSGSAFYDLVFNGTGGNWAFNGAASTTNDFTITNGTVTLSSATTTVGGSFQNSGGTFMHNNGALILSATASGKNIRAGGSSFYNLTANGAGGAWTFLDTNATSSNNFIISAGSVTLPSGIFAVGGSFESVGTLTHNSGTVKLTSVASGKNIQTSGSAFYNLLLNGIGGEWTFLDAYATTSNDFVITNGSTTLPTNVFAVGGSFTNAGTFNSATGTVTFFATATGKTVTASSSPFYNLTFNSSSGGWTVSGNATTTNNFSLTSASSFTAAPGATIAVGAVFSNLVGGTATTWTGSTLVINGASTTINTKSAGGDLYDGTLRIGADVDIRMWNSAATTTVVDATGSLYSQDHGGVDGDLYVWGDYVRSSGNDYWSYATDFDGTSLGGSSRQVNVRVASSSSVTLSGGTLALVGAAGNVTTVDVQGTGRYAFSVTGGTLNANRYHIRRMDANGLNISGTPVVTSLSNGDFELDINGGAMITASSSVIDANASMQISGVVFATSSGITSGFNVKRIGTPLNAWTFIGHTGNYDGEAFDDDGVDACGFIRWSDSACLFVSQEHYRWRSDDGGEGVPADEWFSASWSKRKRVAISNPTSQAYTDIPVQLVVDYDADMQSDFDDLRFTDSGGTTSISHWIEDVNVSASSTVWVNVPSLPASGSAIVYVYYGNGSATDGSVGTTTFAFFDDFEDDNISEYTGGDTGLFQVDTSFNHNGSFGLEADFGDEGEQTTNGGIRQTGSLTTSTSPGNTIRFFQYVDTTPPDDDACTFFAVQAAEQNYAVCFDVFSTPDRVVLAENIEAYSGSAGGTVHDAESVTFSDGAWYEVVVNWVSDNDPRINVTVYDASGAVFATLTSNDSSYSSGGVGFGFWGQHGGWDFYSVRPYIASDPTYVFGAEQANSGATWKVAEDTLLSGQETGENVRLRFSIQNTGATLNNQLYGLEYASKTGALNCESVPYENYSLVPTTSGGCGAAPACMTTSSQFTNQTATAGLLSYPASMTFAQGQLLEDPSNETSALTVPSNAATEVEFNFEMTANATQNAYCFRIAEDGDDLDNYARVAEVQMSHEPTVSNFTLNNDQNIVLTEGATTTISATGTVTDFNGYQDIIQATSSIYRSGVGAQCTADDNSCYQIASTSCTFLDCAGNSCTLSCSADIYFFADPTDAGSTFAADTWLSRVQVEDSSGAVDVVTAAAVELLTLFGLSVDTDIAYDDGGELGIAVGTDTGAVNATTTVSNTGNKNIDIQLSGTNLTGGASSIPVGEQKYATSTFAYSSCSICQFLTGSATSFEVDLPKPTSTSTPIVDDVYWGINIPLGTGNVLHEGTNTFIATSD